eukprot:16438927-Heterocapsa_arctica.AAC.1
MACRHLQTKLNPCSQMAAQSCACVNVQPTLVNRRVTDATSTQKPTEVPFGRGALRCCPFGDFMGAKE